MKVMISQPMHGLTDEQIAAVRERAIEFLTHNGHEVVNTLFETTKQEISEMGITSPGVYFLATSLANMAECHAVYFCEGWKDARGCVFEHEIATSYAIPIMYEKQSRTRRKA